VLAALGSQQDGIRTVVLALRIERWLGRDHGGATEVWLAQQAAHDLWQARATAKAAEVASEGSCA
jgi:plasmid maintenance system antidote protein VapI